MTSSDDMQRKLMDAFRMPSVQTMVSRKSSITNAFVNSVIPAITPTSQEIDEALQILGMTHDDLRCVYCGNRSTEWDHLRPLVLNRRPTGYISEIANLVPACGKCNQSKGNKPWRDWMRSKAKWSPTGRGLTDVEQRIALIERYEAWKTPIQVDFVSAIGEADWEHYWSLCEAVNQEMRSAQNVADRIREKVVNTVQSQSRR